MIRFKKKFKRPMHPWEKQRILEEKALIEEFAYKNKREIWKMQAIVRKYRSIAKKLVSVRTKQQEKERKELLSKLSKLGLISKDATVDAVLGLNVNDISNRRLQTLLHKKGFANTPRQARQFITHGHVFVSNKKIDSPSMLLTVEQEKQIKVVGVKPEKKFVKNVEVSKNAGKEERAKGAGKEKRAKGAAKEERKK